MYTPVKINQDQVEIEEEEANFHKHNGAADIVKVNGDRWYKFNHNERSVLKFNESNYSEIDKEQAKHKSQKIVGLIIISSILATTMMVCLSSLRVDVHHWEGKVELPIGDVPIEKNEFNNTSKQLNLLPALAIDNMQNRLPYHLGKKDHGFLHQNSDGDRVSSRVKNMENLDKIRVDYCGTIHSSTESSNRWHSIDVRTRPKALDYANLGTITFDYFSDSIQYAAEQQRLFSNVEKPTRYEETHSPLKTRRQTFRSVCEGNHPTLHDVKITIERQGPFTSSGGYDWNSVPPFNDVAGLGRYIYNRTVYVVGSMIAPVFANGTIIGYPPLHIHHGHVFPYSYQDMGKKIRNNRFRKNDPFQHHVLFQSHGDTECKRSEGGIACLLHQLPDGFGYRLVNSTGMKGDYEINDVRTKEAPGSNQDLEFYVDVAVLWTYKKQVETTYLQIGNPYIGAQAWMTYQFPLDGNTNFVYFNYTNSILGSGSIQSLVLHSHMSYVDSLYIFKGPKVYHALEKYRNTIGAVIPYIFECHNNESLDIEKAKILTIAAGSRMAELVCEGTKPSLVLDCINDSCQYRDKRLDLNCRIPVKFDREETLVILAFNRVRRTSTLGPISRTHTPQSSLAVASTFGFGFVAHQHTVVRIDFVSNKAKAGRLVSSTGNGTKDFELGAYSPPSLFEWSQWPTSPQNSKSTDENFKNPHAYYVPKKDTVVQTNAFVGIPQNSYLREDMLHGCKKNISFKASFIWERK